MYLWCYQCWSIVVRDEWESLAVALWLPVSLLKSFCKTPFTWSMLAFDSWILCEAKPSGLTQTLLSLIVMSLPSESCHPNYMLWSQNCNANSNHIKIMQDCADGPMAKLSLIIFLRIFYLYWLSTFIIFAHHYWYKWIITVWAEHEYDWENRLATARS